MEFISIVVVAFDRFRKWKRPPVASQGAVSPAGSGLVVPGSQGEQSGPRQLVPGSCRSCRLR